MKYKTFNDLLGAVIGINKAVTSYKKIGGGSYVCKDEFGYVGEVSDQDIFLFLANGPTCAEGEG